MMHAAQSLRPRHRAQAWGVLARTLRACHPMRIDWESYDPNGFHDEMMYGPGRPRDVGRVVADYLASLSTDEIRSRQKAAEAAIEGMGITFTVYSEGSNIDRAWPFDIIPRIIAAKEWARTEAGL